MKLTRRRFLSSAVAAGAIRAGASETDVKPFRVRVEDFVLGKWMEAIELIAHR